MTNKAMLIILDGYGINPNIEGNAVKQAQTPFIDSLLEKYPHCRLKTNGKDVGLPVGVMGNSEVGHLNIGAGRIVYQLNTLIDHKIETKEFFQNKALLSAIEHARLYKSKVHLFGLLSDGGVHSSLNHIDGLLELFHREGFKDVYFHAFMDGRDTLPHSGSGFISDYQQKANQYGLGKIASLCGRYYAMDRDNRWERVQKAYDALVFGKASYDICPLNAILKSYDAEVTDEFILPVIITESTESNSNPIALIEENDAIVFFNFRSDRPRELTKCFIYEDFNEFPVKRFKNLKYVTMTEYDINFSPFVEVAFRNEKLDNILGKVMEDNNLTQLRLAETEKYAHVTFFFNGGVEEPFKGEDRILIPSPKIASYDLQPEMSALGVTESALKILNEKNYDLIIINYANCDMVGHTGVFDAVVKAVETVDKCIAQVIPLALEKGYDIILTADHGNAEQMIDEAGNIMTAHSMNEVFMVLIKDMDLKYGLKNGKLGDIAPTLLNLMDLIVPKEMTGENLIVK
ncbi:MAG: 2,3-bisphosphoglycerate-independent phosphoglycerate mutase [Candidatus Cloacimonetes bacterium]|nr:2,3-bisphosphoglycerate-independent phosphoglycerate mutase [Candidatus Cloacimonadota bacterium]